MDDKIDIPKTITELVEDLTGTICDDFCKYRDTVDEYVECDYMRAHNGKCPLDIL